MDIPPHGRVADEYRTGPLRSMAGAVRSVIRRTTLHSPIVASPDSVSHAFSPVTHVARVPMGPLRVTMPRETRRPVL